MANVITTLLKMDSTQFKTGLKQAQQSVRETDGVVNKAKAGWASAFAGFASSPAAIAGATAAVSAFAVSSVKAASDLDESINAVNVTFGESADKILEFGDNAAKSVGLATAQFNQLATPLGSILKNAGFQLDDVADKTLTLTQRAADMASVFNTDVSDALQAIQAGLRGEQDPLEKYGVSLSAAKVEARALADTGKDTAKSLTDQEKQLARVEIIMEQTNQTAGDFANTSDGLANKSRILSAEFTNLKAKIGEQLTPTFSDAAAGGILFLDVLEQMQQGLDDFKGSSGSSFNPFTSGIGFALNAVKDLNQAWQGGADQAEILEPRLESLARFHRDAADAAQAQATATGDTADEVVDLGDKAANTGAQIGDLSGAFDDAAQHLADLNQQAQDNALGILADAAGAVGDALDAAFGGLEDDLSSLDLLDNITDQFDKVAEAAKNANDPKGVRDYNREVRRLQGELLDYLGTVKDIPPDKVTKIIAQIRTGDIDTLKATLDELTKDRFVNVITRVPQDSFSSLNAVINPAAGTATPIFNNPNPAPTSSTVNNTTIIYPIGSTPTTTYQNQVIDDRRNGPR